MKINKKQIRAFSVEKSGEPAGESIPLSISSELPYLRSWGNEVLLHGDVNVDMTRASSPNGLPILVSHGTDGLPIGRLKNVRLDPQSKKLRGDAFFSARPEAQVVKQDIEDGIINDVSVGYKILDYKIEKAAKADEPPTVFITKWQPYEASMVSVPADYTVGVGRADVNDEEIDLEDEMAEVAEAQAADSDLVEEAEDATEEGEPILEPTLNPESSISVPEEEAPPAVDVEETILAAQAVEAEEDEEEDGDGETLDAESGVSVPPADAVLAPARSVEDLEVIRKLARRMNIHSDSEIEKILSDEKKSISEVKKELLHVAPMVVTSKRGKNMQENLTRSIKAALRGDLSAVDAELLSSGFISSNGSRGLNVDLFGTRADSYTTTTNGGTSTIYEQNIGFLDLLRARTAVLAAGGRTRTGVGNLSYIRQKQAVTAILRGENTGTVAATNADFEKVPYTPKALVAKVYLTDELQKESIVDLQGILREDMVKQFAIALDNYAINGNATTPIINGLLSTGSGIYNGDLGTPGLPTWAAVNHLKGLVDQKAVDLSKAAFLATPALNAVLEATQMFPNYGMPVSMGNRINGYPVYTSSNVPVSGADHTLIFGDFSNLEICLQGATELSVDTMTRFDEGITILTARQYFDVGLLQPQAFAKVGNFLVA